MSEDLEAAKNGSMTPASPGKHGGRRPGLPAPAYWPFVGLLVIGTIYTLAYQVDLADLAILAAGWSPLVRFRKEW